MLFRSTGTVSAKGGVRYPGKRVLVVEDNPINSTVIRELLEVRLGVKVVEAPGGQEALDICRTELFDLVLMDVQMPGMDGLECTRRMRESARQKDVPILALSANVTPEDINACLAAGMDGHLGKPLILDQFLPVLHALWSPEEARDR